MKKARASLPSLGNMAVNYKFTMYIYGRNQSTISTTVKNKEAIKTSKPSKGITVVACQWKDVNQLYIVTNF